MNAKKTNHRPTVQHQEKTFARFTRSQRLEHATLILSTLVLLLTGLPQKYRETSWSQDLLSTPERLELLRQIHYLAAVILMLVVIYHIGNAIFLMFHRKLSAAMLPTIQDVYDAGNMVLYLLFLRKEKPAFGKYNFEQKVTYWFLFFGIGIMVISGFITWFPEFFTRFLPGGVVPAAKLAHSTEAVVAVIFIVVWHLYHVLVERLNLSMFTGRLTEREMREFHAKEYERLTGQPAQENHE